MKQITSWTVSVAISLASLILAGCAGMQQLDNITDAVKEGKVSGLPASTNYVVGGTVWSLSIPKHPTGPYSKISSQEIVVQKGTTNEGLYVFFCGKSYQTKAWEIFSCMKWKTNSWQPVPVSLDKTPIKN